MGEGVFFPYLAMMTSHDLKVAVSLRKGHCLQEVNATAGVAEGTAEKSTNLSENQDEEAHQRRCECPNLAAPTRTREIDTTDSHGMRHLLAQEDLPPGVELGAGPTGAGVGRTRYHRHDEDRSEAPEGDEEAALRDGILL